MTTFDDTPTESPVVRRKRYRRWRILSMTFLFYALIIGVPSLQVAILLMVYPWFILALLAFNPGVDGAPERNPIDLHILLGTVALALRAALLVHVMDDTRIIIPALLPGGFMLVSTALVMRRNGRAPWLALLAALIAGTSYGYGATLFGNAILDRSAPQVYQTRVLEKEMNFGKSAAGPEIKLAPWGPQTEEAWVKHLPLIIYQNVSVGTRVCIYYHPGLANIAWYELHSCRKEHRECRREPICRQWLEETMDRLQKADDAPKQGKPLPPPTE
jgi:hypothetical protein